MIRKITEIARVVRSKNCSPFELTLDMIFQDKAIYETVKRHNAVNAANIAAAYGIPASRISGIVYFDPANAVKVVMARPVASGAPGDTDVYGAQQHAPLLGLKLEV
ncbi:MAG: DUF4387 domain-containing protein [Victivallaceae bacterium]|nr:DUF4387 domain-containing protein [Victivallaceae bacterium]